MLKKNLLAWRISVSVFGILGVKKKKTHFIISLTYASVTSAKLIFHRQLSSTNCFSFHFGKVRLPSAAFLNQRIELSVQQSSSTFGGLPQPAVWAFDWEKLVFLWRLSYISDLGFLFDIVHLPSAVFCSVKFVIASANNFYQIARGVVVIVVGNGHGDTSSNPGRDW